jgi:curved DNA-binding protein CbpA
MYKNIMINNNEIFSRIKKTFEKIKTESHPVPTDEEINSIIEEMVQYNITDIPYLQNIEEFMEQYKDKNSNVYKIENFLSEQSRIRHQQGRGELALHLLFSCSEKSKNGDIKINNKEYEIKKETGILDFAVKTYGEMPKIYNKIIEIRAFVKIVLCKFFQDSDAYKYYIENFSFKINEFKGGERMPGRIKKLKMNDFLKFDYLLSLIKNNESIKSTQEGKLLIDIIDNFNTNDWKNELCSSIINNYSGGILVYRQKKKNKKIIESEYVLYTDASHFIIKNLTLGNVQLKII